MHKHIFSSSVHWKDLEKTSLPFGTQIILLKYHFPLKETKVSKRNG